ncbi:hypothetical protein ACFYTC_18560 [Actinomadura nitritigenes]|uniref:hypothetical protein n=1 Tax=Actinomadura nitritigenes TaxID=134602 RepID=UPI0036B8F1A3
MRPAADRYTRLLRAVETVGKLAQRCDTESLDHLLDRSATVTRLDASTIDALRHTRDSMLMVRRALTTLLEATTADAPNANPVAIRRPLDEPLPTGYRTIDRAEAWRRAYQHLPSHGSTPLLLHIEEFEDGFRALPISPEMPEMPSVPTLKAPATLVVDKASGSVSRWPMLALDVLARRYPHYRQGVPIVFDDANGTTPPSKARSRGYLSERYFRGKVYW